jgi:hypothetical protein
LWRCMGRLMRRERTWCDKACTRLTMVFVQYVQYMFHAHLLLDNTGMTMMMIMISEQSERAEQSQKAQVRDDSNKDDDKG